MANQILVAMSAKHYRRKSYALFMIPLSRLLHFPFVSDRAVSHFPSNKKPSESINCSGKPYIVYLQTGKVILNFTFECVEYFCRGLYLSSV